MGGVTQYLNCATYSISTIAETRDIVLNFSLTYFNSGTFLGKVQQNVNCIPHPILNVAKPETETRPCDFSREVETISFSQ